MKRVNYIIGILLLSGASCVNIFAQQSYVLNGLAELQAFNDGATSPTEKEVVQDLTIRGEDITQTAFNAVTDRVKEVLGTLTLENLTYGDGLEGSESVMNFYRGDEETGEYDLPIKGGLVIRNCPHLKWPDGGLLQFVDVPGDFILEKTQLPTPWGEGWEGNSFKNLRTVGGDLILRNFDRISGSSFPNLASVGGTFELSYPRSPWSWDINDCPITRIGGDLIINGMPDPASLPWPDEVEEWLFENLQGFKNLRHIGGNVRIINCPRMAISGGWEGRYDYCWIRYLIDEGYIDYANYDVVLGYEDEPVDLAIVGGCFDGVTEEDPPYPLPEKNTKGIHNAGEGNSLSIYPNPIVGNTVIVQINNLIQKVEVIDLTGKCILAAADVNSVETTLDVSALGKGYYILRVTTGKGNIETAKIIKL
ncbi:MAG: T9SS type A sorting domain-containing protein [Candidatus Azobacteroides sp.]|nr:T9SS type A sorting domain-containing protein [Candidatus Azobacteroides sp.]